MYHGILLDSRFAELVTDKYGRWPPDVDLLKVKVISVLYVPV